MPKNKKPAGGRPARNFDPAYAKTSRTKNGRPDASAGRKPGSRSPGHRGYRPEEAAEPKQRWSREEREATGRSAHRSSASRDERAQRRDRDDRPRRDDRDRRDGGRGYDRDDRPRRDDRDSRGGSRGYDRTRRDDRDRRDGGRRYDRDERPRRDDRDLRSGARRSDGDDRSRRVAGRGYDHDDARRRDRDRGERPRRDHDDRRVAGRGYDRDDRRDRGYDRDVRAPRRDDRAPRRDDRAPRRDDRAPRRDDRDQRGGSRGADRPGFRESERRPSTYFPAKDDRAAYTPEDDVVLERLEAEAISAEAVEGVTFADLGLGGNIVRALGDLGAEHPFPIQAATIPVVLEGRDVLGRGRTGSGKTIAFGAPTVERLMQMWASSGKTGEKRKLGRAPRALILAPTRELALQIDRTVQPIAQSVGLFTTQIYGGVPQGRQVGALQRGVDIVIGTPGRIEDLVEQRRLDLSEVEITVLDEADHMCDLGFLEPVQRIIRRTRAGGQKLLFSATLDTGVAALVGEFLVDPAVHEVAGETQASGTIEHRVLVIRNDQKRDIVAQLARHRGKTLVFSRTRAFAEDLVEHLEDRGVFAVALHGDLNQARRTRNLQQLTSGKVDVLVATDVAARGIHVDDIDLVIQADAPDEYKTYLHRSGRTGRAGKRGVVVTLIPRGRHRRMTELLGRAEIEAEFDEFERGDEFTLAAADEDAPPAE
ncbi:DEAD/DEAH box helicase [Agromyces sp. SYSU T00194]|uniref:DEAD/DEAH box helicase n=1 Tax=Agromyces chitinivorans TaxID=3158560 RepID=UPI0033963F02